MILNPFTFGAHRVEDIQDATPSNRHRLAVALRDGMALMPIESKCEALGVTPEGDYVAMHLGIYSGPTLIGAWWLGAHEAAAEHTTDAARIYSRLCPGPVAGHEPEFWDVALAMMFAKYLLWNLLPTRAGGSVQFVGFDYAMDSNIAPDSPASILLDIDAMAHADDDLQLTHTDLGAGVVNHRWELVP